MNREGRLRKDGRMWFKTKNQLPVIGKVVLCCIEEDSAHNDYFVGYYVGPDAKDGDWRMETERLNCDQHRNDVFGEVAYWMEIPKLEVGENDLHRKS